MPRRRWLELAIPLLSGAVYVGTASPHVVGGDSGEFATLLATGGVAHPPGFPLYVMLLRAFRFVPAESPAHAAALLSAASATLTVYVLMRAARLYGASVEAAAVASAMFASAALTWKLATHGEVFSQAALFAALVVLVSAPALPLRGVRRAGLLGVVAGLALATHPALVLVAPIGLYAFARALRDEPGRLRSWVVGLVALLVGLSPYLFILLSARSADPLEAWVWGEPVDLPGLLRHFARVDYGPFKLDAGNAKPAPLAQLGRFATTAVLEFLCLPLIVAAALILCVKRTRAAPAAFRQRGHVIALGAAFFTSGVFFIGLFNRPLIGVGPSIVERFYLLPMVPLTVLAALSLSTLVPFLLEHRFGMLLPLLTLVSGFSLAADPVREYTRPTLQYYVDNVLAYVPAGTVLVGDGDHLVAGFLYGLRGQKQRNDVEFLSPQLLNADWYRERASRKLGVRLVRREGPKSVDHWLEQLLTAGRTVMLAGTIPSGLEQRFSTIPEGSLVRVLPKGTPAPPPELLEAMNLKIYSGFDIEAEPPREASAWNRLVHSYYARTWVALSRAFAARAQVVEARRCRARALKLAPWLAATLPE
jgi:hypothetical protein